MIFTKKADISLQMMNVNGKIRLKFIDKKRSSFDGGAWFCQRGYKKS